MKSYWRPVQEVVAVVRPVWLAAVISIGTALVLHHSQAVDVLVGIATDAGFFSVQHFLLLVSLLTLGFCSWYFPRSVLYVEYWFTPSTRERFEKSRLWLPRILGVAPMVSLALAYARGGKLGLGLFDLIVAALFMIFLIYRRKIFPSGDPTRLGWYPKMPKRTFAAMMSLVALSVALLLTFLATPVSAPQSVGPIGIIFFAMATWIAVGSAALIYPTYRYRLPSLVVLALILVTVFSIWNDNHQVRTLPDDGTVWQRPTVEQQFKTWYELRAPARAAFAEDHRRYPVFVVAAEGGGIRAAYWTAAVLANLEDAYPGFGCHVFAISGVSGGSLGAALFAGLIADRDDAYHCDQPHSGASEALAPRVQQILADDFLAPAMAGLLFPDTLQRFLPVHGRLSLPDRATYLESAWEKAWRGSTESNRFEESFRGLWDDAGASYRVPSLFLNGTWVDDGGRAVTSNLRPASTTFVKLDDLVASFGKRMRLSTAVHMSARFTWVSPSGTVRIGDQDRRIVDGGYFENSGALTAAEIVSVILEIDPTVEIHALIITNYPRHPENPERTPSKLAWAERILPETFSPIRALFMTRMARGFHADRFFEEAVEDRVFRFHLPQIGAEEVPLGWMLSSETRGGIDEAARDHLGVNAVSTLLSTAPRKQSDSVP